LLRCKPSRRGDGLVAAVRLLFLRQDVVALLKLTDVRRVEVALGFLRLEFGDL
jgi:hypothetical protein